MSNLAEICMFCSLEWWSFELLVLLSGLLPNPKLEASVLSIWWVMFSWFGHTFCIQFASSDRVPLNFLQPELGFLGIHDPFRPWFSHKVRYIDQIKHLIINIAFNLLFFFSSKQLFMNFYNDKLTTSQCPVLRDLSQHPGLEWARRRSTRGGPSGQPCGDGAGSRRRRRDRARHDPGAPSMGLRVQQRGGGGPVRREDDAHSCRLVPLRWPAVCSVRSDDRCSISTKKIENKMHVIERLLTEFFHALIGSFHIHLFMIDLYIWLLTNILSPRKWLTVRDSSGVARGCGWQKIGAIVNLGAYYLVGIPAALCFAFVYHLGGMVILLLT